MNDKPNSGSFGPGNTHAWKPGQSGNGNGRKPRPPEITDKARLADAWFHGFAAGTANADMQLAVRKALTEAWSLGNLAPRDEGEGAIKLRDDEVDALMRRHLAQLQSAAIAVQPTKEQLFAAVKVIEWTYGKAVATVDVTGNENTNLLLEVLRARVIEASAKTVEAKQLPNNKETEER